MRQVSRSAVIEHRRVGAGQHARRFARTWHAIHWAVFLLSVVHGGTLPAQPPRPPAPVSIAPVVERETAVWQQYVGTVVPLKTSVIGSAVDGRVVDFPVNEGDFVKKGQPLAHLLTETIKLEVVAAQAELKLREHELQELLNGTRPEDVARAAAKMKSARARYEYEQARRKRSEELFQRGTVNEDDHLLIVSEEITAEQTWVEAEQAWKLAVSGPREETIEQARARVAMQTAVAQNLEDRVKKHTIVAPFDGYVTSEHTEVGQWLQRGETVAEVIALEQVDVLVHVLEQHVDFLKLHEHLNVEVPAASESLLSGEVALIVHKADPRSRTFPVKIRLQNWMIESGPALKSGMLSRVNLPTGESGPALLIPKDALVLGGQTPLVFVVDPAPMGQGGGAIPPAAAGPGDSGGVIRPVPVQIGLATGRLIAIRGGLKAGERVVVRGNERVRPGQPVSIVETLDPEAVPRARAINNDSSNP